MMLLDTITKPPKSASGASMNHTVLYCFIARIIAEAVREDLAAVISKVSLNDVPERAALCALVDERIETQVCTAHARILEIEPERAALAAELKAIRAGLSAVSAAVGDALFYA